MKVSANSQHSIFDATKVTSLATNKNPKKKPQIAPSLAPFPLCYQL